MRPDHGVLWDLDGVIVDTQELHYVTWAEVLLNYQIPFSREKFESIFGMNNHDTLATLMGSRPEPEMIESIAGRKEQLFREMLEGKLQAMPGVMAWLVQFGAWHWPQAVASSAPMPNIEAIVDELGIRRFFAALVSGLNMPGKPAPDVFLEAAQRIAISPVDCVVIEDSVVGVRAAKGAGMFCIAVITTTSREKLHQADRIVDSLDLLPDKFLY